MNSISFAGKMGKEEAFWQRKAVVNEGELVVVGKWDSDLIKCDLNTWKWEFIHKLDWFPL